MKISYVTITSEDEGIRIDRWFKRYRPLWSFVQVAKLLRTGQIRLDGKRVKPENRLKVGAVLRFPELELAQASTKRNGSVNKHGQKLAKILQDQIIYSNDDFVVLNKPFGIATQGGTKISVSLDDALEFLIPEGSPKLVHRLDKETSGLIIIAKSASVASAFAEMFQKRYINKTYIAVLNGVPNPKKGIINYKLRKKTKGDFENMKKDDNGVIAITDYIVLDYAFEKVSLVQFVPKTGRMHQLRAHSQSIGCPILGDHKYYLPNRPKLSEVEDKLHLLSYSLSFQFKGKEYSFVAPIPAFFESTIKYFGLAFNI